MNLLECMIQICGSALGISDEMMIESDFAGCLRGIHGMIIEAQAVDQIIEDACADLARKLDDLFWLDGRPAPGEEIIMGELIGWLGDIMID